MVDYSAYLRKRHGCKVYKIGLDAGFTCPNRDGTKGKDGCLYCDDRGSRSPYTNPSLSVREQLESRIAYLKEKKGAGKFIAYFQAFSNTYAPKDRLKAVYDEVLPFEEIVGISIGTRPDTIDAEKLELIASYKDRYDLWIEYGLQTVHDRTLAAIGRGHSYKDFLDAVRLTRRSGIPICAHVILGLPGETREDMMETARELGRLAIEGVKIHLLHVLKGSRLERLYEEGKFTPLSLDEYAGLVCYFLGHLSAGTIIHRLTGEGERTRHLAPEWALDKRATLDAIRDRLAGKAG